MALLQSVLKASSNAPDFSLKGIDGKTYTLGSFKDARALLVVFMCNHCPYVLPKVPVMNALYGDYHSKGFAMIGINPNDAQKYPEDSFENMKKFAQARGIIFPYVIDATQTVAKSYGAVCTPDAFLFNQERKLIYQGRFDDALSPTDSSTTRDMAEAIEAVLVGKKPKKSFLFSQGCSIKWKV